MTPSGPGAANKGPKLQKKRTTETMTPKLTKTSAGQLILQNVQGAYPSLYKAESFKGDERNVPRFGITILIPKTATDVVDQLQAEINKLAKEKHKLPKLPEADSCLRDGDTKSNEAMHGHWVLSLYAYPNEKSQNGGAPQVMDMSPERRPIKEGASNTPYSGAYVNVLFDLYAPNNWKKVSGGLKVVQFVKDGPTIGTTTDVSEMPTMPDEPIDEDFDV